MMYYGAGMMWGWWGLMCGLLVAGLVGPVAVALIVVLARTHRS